MSLAIEQRRVATHALPVTVGGIAFLADPSGALVLPEERLLIVADLHLEKGSSFARRGQLLPPYDTRHTVLALAAAIHRHAPARVFVLGDTLHDRDAFDRIGAEDRAALAALQLGRDWVWLTGNHDPRIPDGLGGTRCAELSLGGVTFRHAPVPGAEGEIAGHLHPAGKMRGLGRSGRRRCFVSDGRRCILPAFGAYAGGLNVLDPAIRRLFPSGAVAHMMGQDRLYAVSLDRLSAD